MQRFQRRRDYDEDALAGDGLRDVAAEAADEYDIAEVVAVVSAARARALG